MTVSISNSDIRAIGSGSSVGRSTLEDKINGNGGGFVGAFALADLPDASANENCLATVTDANPTPIICYSDGTDWIDPSTGIAVVNS